jgi:hypothetical protein
MGKYTNAAIEAWQQNAGIEPATGERAEILDDLSRAAFEMIKFVELERSGIRGGDGRWRGGDVIGGTTREMIELCEKLMKSYDDEYAEQMKRHGDKDSFATLWATPVPAEFTALMDD